MLKKPIIEVKDLKVSYSERTILENVNFEIYSGEIFVIVGGSGCGKSTLLRQLIGIEQPYSGSIIIDGEDLTNANPKKRTEIMKKYGVLFQSSGLIASMSIAENIALVLESIKDLTDETIYDIIKIKLNSVGLDGFQDFLPAEISGGMKKRAALARAMTLDPKILCFDEPSSGLDPTTAAALDNLIKEINRSFKTTMIVVTHDLASILNISDRIIMLDKSIRGIIASGTPDELKNNNSNQIVHNFFNRIG
ncbi:MAG: ATP-binding cassette domain-containing protein [Ignavibacteria bacterium]|jgi:phospholipid/cholesterol/gamma-HCH transport system ATP-binding protein|nr:ATP-binding cassette domain-containing protein [Ignavibacteria bacterium]